MIEESKDDEISSVTSSSQHASSLSSYDMEQSESTPKFTQSSKLVSSENLNDINDKPPFEQDLNEEISPIDVHIDLTNDFSASLVENRKKMPQRQNSLSDKLEALRYETLYN